jgi:hypothetical protein
MGGERGESRDARSATALAERSECALTIATAKRFVKFPAENDSSS